MKNLIIAIISTSCLNIGCSQSLGPGYSFELFKNTPNWDLAKAVAKEDTAEIYKITKSGKVDVNLQEPQFGRTLLMLAVGNDKEVSTAALLKMGADLRPRDNRDDQAIHEAVAYIDLRKHSLGILKILLAYGADINSVSSKGSNSVPLEGAIENFSCARLLLDNGANPYFKKGDTYSVWFNLMTFNLPFDEDIYVAKYMIVDKKMSIPNPIFYTFSQKKPIDFISMLNKYDVTANPNKEKAKKDIINYLHKINFPQNGIYTDTVR